MYHIKKDGQCFCGKIPNKKIKNEVISFSSAQFSTLKLCCPICKDVYINELREMSNVKRAKI